MSFRISVSVSRSGGCSWMRGSSLGGIGARSSSSASHTNGRTTERLRGCAPHSAVRASFVQARADTDADHPASPMRDVWRPKRASGMSPPGRERALALSGCARSRSEDQAIVRLRPSPFRSLVHADIQTHPAEAVSNDGRLRQSHRRDSSIGHVRLAETARTTMNLGETCLSVVVASHHSFLASTHRSTSLRAKRILPPSLRQGNRPRAAQE